MQVNKKSENEIKGVWKRLNKALKTAKRLIKGEHFQESAEKAVNEEIICCRKAIDAPDAYNYLRDQFNQWKLTNNLTYEQIYIQYKIHPGQLNFFIKDITNERECEYKNYIISWLMRILNITPLQLLRIKHNDRVDMQLARENQILRERIAALDKDKKLVIGRLMGGIYQIKQIVSTRNPDLLKYIECVNFSIEYDL